MRTRMLSLNRGAVFYALSLIIAFLTFAEARASGQPRIFFPDLESGPNSGGENNNGAIVTVYGRGFGKVQGSSEVTVGSGKPAQYRLWSDSKIAFQLGRAAASGNIVVTVNGVASNPVPFTVRTGKIYFVAASGNDNAAGSFASPWRTLPLAIRRTEPGDTVYALDGVSQTTEDDQGWRAALTFRNEWCSTGGPPRALVAYPGAKVVIGSIQSPVLSIRTTDQSAGGGACAGNWVIAGLTLYSAGGAAVAGGSQWRFVGNEISCPNGDGAGACFESSRATFLKFLGNYVHDTGKPNASALYHGVYFSTDSNHVEMGWNTVANARGCRGVQVHSSPLGSGGASDPTGYNQFDLSIHDNVIHDTQCDGIVLYTVDPSKGKIEIFNNLIYNAGLGPNNPEQTGTWSCINVQGHTNNGPAGGGIVEVSANTLYNCGSFAVPPYTGASGAILNGGENRSLKIRLRNNILVQPTKTPFLLMPSGTEGNCSVDAACTPIFGSENLFFGTPTAPQTPGLVRSVLKDPLFVDAARGDFHLRSGSPAIGVGRDSGQRVDLEGKPRPTVQGVDLGALQAAFARIAGLRCDTDAVLSPAFIVCRVLLSGGEGSGTETTVRLESSTPNLKVPGSLSVPSGADAVEFRPEVALVLSRELATLTVRSDSETAVASKLWLLPPNSPVIWKVRNAASLQDGAVSPGQLVSVFGANLSSGVLPAESAQTELLGSRVLVNEQQAALHYVSPGQINLSIPAGTSTTASPLTLGVNASGKMSNDVQLAQGSTSPGIFTVDGSGQGPALARNSDGEQNSPSTPASRGSVITFYGTGFGERSRTESNVQPVAPLAAWVGGYDSDVLRAASAPGSPEGVLEIQLRIPESVKPAANVPLLVMAGSKTSQADVTIAVQ